MKWRKTNGTANEGVLHVQNTVNAHGSIFRPIHQETDIGIDGYIELVRTENATGSLVAVQIKSGDSYLASSDAEFLVKVDPAHLDYWCSYMIPVVLICYSPKKKMAAWTAIRDHKKPETGSRGVSTTTIRIPVEQKFDKKALDNGLAGLVRIAIDRRILINCVDNCLTGQAKDRLHALSILAAHPDSRESQTTVFVARKLIFDSDHRVATKAIFTLAFHVGRSRWWRNNEERELKATAYASALCTNFTAAEIRTLIERIDQEDFGGPDALGERVFDLLSCCDATKDIMYQIAVDVSQPIERRCNAFYMFHDCYDDEILGNPHVMNNSAFKEVIDCLYPFAFDGPFESQ